MRAPIAGTVSGSVLDAGSVITADTTDLTAVVALDPMYVVFNLDEKTALRLKSLNKKHANPESAYPSAPVGLTAGEMTVRNAQFSLADLHLGGSGTARFRAAISNQDGFLFPGPIRVRARRDEHAAQGLTCPGAAFVQGIDTL